MSSSPSTPEPLDPSFRLELPTFQGPLDLLLHLIQKHELEILDLPIAFVTERYLSYIQLMERLDLDIASEYLVMAATLAHIKSKTLLPPDPDEQQDDGLPEEEIDPRQELIRRLLEYQKYKAAAEQLGARGVQGRDVFLRGMEAPEATGPAPLAGVGLFKLLDAFQAVLKRAKQDLAFEITTEGVSIQDRMSQLTERLRTKRQCTFDELFEDVKTMIDVVVTFLALLEMAKRRLASIYQTDPTAPIHVEFRVLDVEDDGSGSDPYGSGTEEAAPGPAAPDPAATPAAPPERVEDDAPAAGGEDEPADRETEPGSEPPAVVEQPAIVVGDPVVPIPRDVPPDDAPTAPSAEPEDPAADASTEREAPLDLGQHVAHDARPEADPDREP
jgi:segregation and condensation protein A